MNYCCVGCAKCCKGCNKCCNDCCNSCCKCFESCCGECCEAINDCFQRPFSLCTFVSFFVVGVPFILMISVFFKDYTDKCSKPLHIWLPIQGTSNLINLLFCGYLCYQFSQGYNNKIDRISKEEIVENNVLDKVKNLFLYDCFVFFYVILLIFFLVWTIIGTAYIEEEQICNKQYKYFYSIAIYNLYAMWIFLTVGTFIFVFVICFQAYDEGSLNCRDICACIFLCMSCGFCDMRDKNRKERIRKKMQAKKQKQKPGWQNSMNNWMGRFGMRQNRENYYQPQQNVQNVQMNNQQMNHPQMNVQQGYPVNQGHPNQQQQYNYPHQSQVQQKKKEEKKPGFFGKLKKILKK